MFKEVAKGIMERIAQSVAASGVNVKSLISIMLPGLREKIVDDLTRQFFQPQQDAMSVSKQVFQERVRIVLGQYSAMLSSFVDNIKDK